MFENNLDSDKLYINSLFQWSATSQWFSPGTSVSSTNKTALNTITLTLYINLRGRCRRDRMVVGFTPTTCGIGAYHH